MSDLVIDSSVVAKWILPESDSAAAQRLIDASLAGGSRLIVLDLVFPEVANTIWKQRRRNEITTVQAERFLANLGKLPLNVEPANDFLAAGLGIAIKYDRAVYDALFVALAQQRGMRGVTADEPLFNVTHADFPQIVLLRHL